MMLSDNLKEFILLHENDNIHTLALQANKYKDIDLDLAIRQIVGRQVAKQKLPSWYACEDILYPKHLSLEQCSSEATASFKASLVKGDTFVDLTGGLGVDFSFMSRQFEQATYLEQQEELVKIAEHNFKYLGLQHAEPKYGIAEKYLRKMDKVNTIYLDPARRDNHGRKTVSIEDCTPNLCEIEDLLEAKAETILIKLSPMLDISKALNTLKNISNVYIVSHKNECKELLFLKNKFEGETQIHCINIEEANTNKFSFTYELERETNISYASSLGKYLYEPNSSILKAGAYKSPCNEFSIQKLHPSSHLYTSTEVSNNFQGRKFEVLDCCTLNKKELKKSLATIEKANITTRNFPLSVDELRKRLKLQDGGEVYIFATTLADNQKTLIICKKL